MDVNELPEDNPELVRLRDAHRDHYATWADGLRAAVEEQRLPWDAFLDRLDDEAANLRSASEWALRRPGPALAQLTRSLASWWQQRAQIATSRSAVEALVASDQVPDEARLSALVDAASAIIHTGHNDIALLAAENAVELARRLGDRPNLARALRLIGWSRFMSGRADALEVLEEAAPLSADLPAWERADLLRAIGFAALHAGDHDRARSVHDEALALLRGDGDLQALASHLSVHANLLNQVGESEAAASMYREAIEAHAAAGNGRQRTMSMAYLAEVEDAGGRHAAAMALLEEAMLTPPADEPDCRSYLLKAAARAALALGDLDRAAALVEEGRALFGAMEEVVPNLQARLDDLMVTGLLTAVERGDLMGVRRSAADLLAEADTPVRYQRLVRASRGVAMTGETDLALALLDRALEDLRQPSGALAERWRQVVEVERQLVLGNLGDVASLHPGAAVAAGDAEAARRYLEQERESRAGRGVEQELAALDGAVDELRRSIGGAEDIGRPSRTIAYLERLAEATARADDPDAAVGLLAAATALREERKMPPDHLARARRERIAELTAGVDDERRARLEGESRAVDAVTILEEALR